MGFRFKDKKDIKTFILYLLMQVEKPIELETLNDIVVQDDYVNQFDFMDAFFELCQTGAVTSSKESGGFNVHPYASVFRFGYVVEGFDK